MCTSLCDAAGNMHVVDNVCCRALSGQRSTAADSGPCDGPVLALLGGLVSVGDHLIAMTPIAMSLICPLNQLFSTQDLMNGYELVARTARAFDLGVWYPSPRAAGSDASPPPRS